MTTTPPPEGTTEPREHSCDNCDGTDPDSCMRRYRAARSKEVAA